MDFLNILNGVILTASTVCIYFANKEYRKLKLSVCILSLAGNLIRIPVMAYFKKKSNTSLRNFTNFKIYLLAAIYEVQMLLVVNYVGVLQPIYNFCCIQTKFFFLFFLQLLVLKKGFKIIQCTGIFLVLVGLLITIIEQKGSALKKPPKDILAAAVGLISSAFCSSLATVFFEKYIKPTVTDFKQYMFVYSSSSAMVSMVFVSSEFLIRKDLSLTACFSTKFMYITAFLSCLNVLLISYMSIKILPFERTLYLQLISLISNIISEFISEKKVPSFLKFLGLFVVNCGVFLYDYENVKKFFENIFSKYKNENITSNHENMSQNIKFCDDKNCCTKISVNESVYKNAQNDVRNEKAKDKKKFNNCK
ncbi:hypothetical protein EDEG_03066 [Edhazardia aedis USNM 41457]|uniref:EamA domain-containing protein n=1 Tax=Edhazardia aedis (strain USNM 41457) TaxID=1003232 RepID=J9DMD1_EDHAE|nr:hypothetical protein EDEG_03066 [Edhazardia aedis USNM 41457]|eukprot:EJW02527.1 hypothetical protein EDEG_03066 [Edhazardia aedis USNM 41457]